MAPGGLSGTSLVGETAQSRRPPRSDERLACTEIRRSLRVLVASLAWARLLARSQSEVVDVFDRDANRICSGVLTRQPEGRAALVPDHHYVMAHYAERDGQLMTHLFVPWPSMHTGAT